MGNKFLLPVAIFFLTFSVIESIVNAEKNMFEVDKEGGITSMLTNASLQEVLKNFCSTFKLDLKGATASDETISLTITKGTFDETLKRLMRGYNYVLMQDATSAKLSLMLLGKADRRKYIEGSAGAPAATERVAHAPAAAPPGQRTLPPSPQPAPASVKDLALSRSPASAEHQRQPDEERVGSAVTSASPAHTQSSTSSAPPPMPPNISGLEMPPMPPTPEQAKGAQPNVVAGENSSGVTYLQAPPEIPADRNSTQPKTTPKVGLKDITPPPTPF
jgi:hypothetical protein